MPAPLHPTRLARVLRENSRPHYLDRRQSNKMLVRALPNNAENEVSAAYSSGLLLNATNPLVQLQRRVNCLRLYTCSVYWGSDEAIAQTECRTHEYCPRFETRRAGQTTCQG